MAQPLARIVAHCDRLLRTAEFEDYSGAVNGLQMENRGRIIRIAAAVDASLATIRLAADAKANLLIVHHGLFWNPTHPWTGPRYTLLRALLDHDMAVYSSHLPLDAHPVLGNNILLCSALGLRNPKPFFHTKGRFLGWRVRTSITRQELARRLTEATGMPARVLPAGPTRCQAIGIVTGGAGGDLKLAAREGVDTFVTGEGPHWTFSLAEEAGLNVLYGGHYATETFGVKALAENLSRKFNLPWTFVDHPSGL